MSAPLLSLGISMNDQETRIQFFERQGWKLVREDDGEFCLYNSYGESVWSDFDPDTTMESCAYVLPIIDHNHVHAALMGMSEEEWKHFANKLILLIQNLEGFGSSTNMRDMVIQCFKTSLPTLVTCYLEATKGRNHE